MSDQATIESEDGAPPPPPPNFAPRRGGAQPQRQRQQQDRQQQHAPQAAPNMNDPFVGEEEQQRSGVDPMALLGDPTQANVIRIERIRCDGNETEETGFCGLVSRMLDFERDVARRWGGGDYLAKTTSDTGRLIARPFTIPGPSKPLVRDEEAEAAAAAEAEALAQAEAEAAAAQAAAEAASTYTNYGDQYDPESGLFGRRRRRRGGFYQGPGGPGYDHGPGGYDPYGQPVPPPGPFNPGYGHYQQPGYPQPGYGQQQPYYPQPGYGQQGYGTASPPFAPPFAPPAPAAPRYGQLEDPVAVAAAKEAAKAVAEKEEAKFSALQEQIEEARAAAREAQEQAAQEREERRLEAERAAASKRESELKREIDQLRADQERRADDMKRQIEAMQASAQQQTQALMAELRASQSVKGGGMADKLVEMQLANLASQAQRVEQERLERDQRSREEAVIRREEAAKREADLRREGEARDRQRADERSHAETVRREERERDETRRKESEAHYQQIMTLSLGQKQSPEQMLAMLQQMVALRPERDTMEEVMKLANVAITLKDLLGGQPEAEDKWSGIIRAGTEALGRAVGDIQARRAAAEGPQAPPQQLHDTQAHQLPGPAQVRQPAPQPQPVYQNPDVSGEEWGRILGFVVDAHDSNNDPETTATHMHTMIMVGMQRPKAIEALEDATTADLKFRLSAMLLMPDVARSFYKRKIDRMLDVLNTKKGAAWAQELLDNLTAIQGAVRESAQQQVAAMQAQAQGATITPMPAAESEGDEDEDEDAPDDESPEEFAARSRGAGKAPQKSAAPDLSPEEFARQARGNVEAPKKDPTGGWGEPAK